MVTLSLLMDVIGLPPSLANGTNRVNVLAQCTASGIGYYKNDKLDFKSNAWIIAIMMIGAVLGVIAVLNLSNEAFKEVFKYLIIVLFFTILIKPSKWMRERSGVSDINIFIRGIAFFLLGFYGGFIQMGMGIFFLAAMIFLEKSTLIKANGLKVTIVAMYTLLVLCVFWYKGMIYWEAGLLVAIGQTIGGYITAKYSSKSPNANKWAYYALVTIVLVVIIYQFGFAS